MPGHFGAATKTIRNLQVININESENILTITGTVPGARNSLVKITKIGTAKKPIKLFSKEKPSDKKPVKSKESTKSKKTTKLADKSAKKPAKSPANTKQNKAK